MNEARRLPIGAVTIFLVGASRYLGYAWFQDGNNGEICQSIQDTETSWEDMLSSYDGRNLTSDELRTWNPPRNKIAKLYQCPLDGRSPRSDINMRRNYAINRYFCKTIESSGWNNAWSGGADYYQHPESVNSPSAAILMTEVAADYDTGVSHSPIGDNNDGTFGCGATPDLINPATPGANLNSFFLHKLHPKVGSAAWLFIDGHVDSGYANNYTVSANFGGYRSPL